MNRVSGPEVSGSTGGAPAVLLSVTDYSAVGSYSGLAGLRSCSCFVAVDRQFLQLLVTWEDKHQLVVYLPDLSAFYVGYHISFSDFLFNPYFSDH